MLGTFATANIRLENDTATLRRFYDDVDVSATIGRRLGDVLAAFGGFPATFRRRSGDVPATFRRRSGGLRRKRALARGQEHCDPVCVATNSSAQAGTKPVRAAGVHRVRNSVSGAAELEKTRLEGSWASYVISYALSPTEVSPQPIENEIKR